MAALISRHSKSPDFLLQYTPIDTQRPKYGFRSEVKSVSTDVELSLKYYVTVFRKKYFEKLKIDNFFLHKRQIYFKIFLAYYYLFLIFLKKKLYTSIDFYITVSTLLRFLTFICTDFYVEHPSLTVLPLNPDAVIWPCFCNCFRYKPLFQGSEFGYKKRFQNTIWHLRYQ